MKTSLTNTPRRAKAEVTISVLQVNHSFDLDFKESLIQFIKLVLNELYQLIVSKV